jgi:hypothetical protein
MVESFLIRAYTFLTGEGFDWYVCGGWAIDVFLGKQTRIHKDLDIAVFWEDRNSIVDFTCPPEMVLFYKSRYLEFSPDKSEHDQDFEHVLPFLDEEQKQWLKEFLEKEFGQEHVWLRRLEPC